VIFHYTQSLRVHVPYPVLKEVWIQILVESVRERDIGLLPYYLHQYHESDTFKDMNVSKQSTELE